MASMFCSGITESLHLSHLLFYFPPLLEGDEVNQNCHLRKAESYHQELLVPDHSNLEPRYIEPKVLIVKRLLARFESPMALRSLF